MVRDSGRRKETRVASPGGSMKTALLLSCGFVLGLLCAHRVCTWAARHRIRLDLCREDLGLSTFDDPLCGRSNSRRIRRHLRRDALAVGVRFGRWRRLLLFLISDARISVREIFDGAHKDDLEKLVTMLEETQAVHVSGPVE